MQTKLQTKCKPNANHLPYNTFNKYQLYFHCKTTQTKVFHEKSELQILLYNSLIICIINKKLVFLFESLS